MNKHDELLLKENLKYLANDGTRVGWRYNRFVDGFLRIMSLVLFQPLIKYYLNFKLHLLGASAFNESKQDEKDSATIRGNIQNADGEEITFGLYLAHCKYNIIDKMSKIFFNQGSHSPLGIFADSQERKFFGLLTSRPDL